MSNRTREYELSQDQPSKKLRIENSKSDKMSIINICNNEMNQVDSHPQDEIAKGSLTILSQNINGKADENKDMIQFRRKMLGVKA